MEKEKGRIKNYKKTKMKCWESYKKECKNMMKIYFFEENIFLFYKILYLFYGTRRNVGGWMRLTGTVPHISTQTTTTTTTKRNAFSRRGPSLSYKSPYKHVENHGPIGYFMEKKEFAWYY
jgi:hypothetical protein